MFNFIILLFLFVLTTTSFAQDMDTFIKSLDPQKNPYQGYKFPENRFKDAGKKEAQNIFDNYNSPEFKKKIEDEMNRIKANMGMASGEVDLKAKLNTEPEEQVYIFISSSMPLSTLRNYAISIDNPEGFHTGKKKNPSTVMAMRGFKDGMKYFRPTLEFIASIINKDPSCDMSTNKCLTYNAGVNIDPNLFTKYQIDRVPAIVYVRGNTHKKIYGDIPLDYALEKFEKENQIDNSFNGQTYEIVERNAIDEMKERAAKVNWDEKVKVSKDTIKNYRPQHLIPLKQAEKDRTFSVDLTYTLEFDIIDAQGQIIYPKGYTFNPLDYIKYPNTLVVINGNSKDELTWLRSSPYYQEINTKLLITDGPYYDLSRDLKRPVFYADKTFIDLFHLEATPSIIKQGHRVMEVKEIYVERK